MVSSGGGLIRLSLARVEKDRVEDTSCELLCSVKTELLPSREKSVAAELLVSERIFCPLSDGCWILIGGAGSMPKRTCSCSGG